LSVGNLNVGNMNIGDNCSDGINDINDNNRGGRLA
jgi:hypothetical protein